MSHGIPSRRQISAAELERIRKAFAEGLTKSAIKERFHLSDEYLATLIGTAPRAREKHKHCAPWLGWFV